ncbi:MAG: isoprenylcysteine carboxylmethyltransferase family protein [Gemmatimonadetes bacterium]|nr:isoprenylcysteine carboxylmethyltransferase family protein [Gemmatimonadota bacterium]
MSSAARFWAVRERPERVRTRVLAAFRPRVQRLLDDLADDAETGADLPRRWRRIHRARVRTLVAKSWCVVVARVIHTYVYDALSGDTKPMNATENRTETRRRDTADVIAPPPVLFGTALIAALAAHAVHPIRIAAFAGGVLRLAGVAPIALGLALSVGVMRAFGRAATPVPPYRPTTRLVTTGLYRYTRNPDYIGQTLVYVGVAVAANSWWPLFLLPAVLLVVKRGVVVREERYLEAKFGAAYRDYAARVPRWL